ncbi:MAG: hypothetical protein IIT60_02035, partial [Muribaculaceae bacterium]|nr:hypothetical protein [Muribaculaceae bacterium]
DYPSINAVVTNRASRMQSQIYLNFAEAMPIDGRAQVTTLQQRAMLAYKFHLSRLSHLSHASHASPPSPKIHGSFVIIHGDI